MLLNVSLFDNELDQDENNDNKERGLSELVRLCFGKPLNKSGKINIIKVFIFIHKIS